MGEHTRKTSAEGLTASSLRETIVREISSGTSNATSKKLHELCHFRYMRDLDSISEEHSSQGIPRFLALCQRTLSRGGRLILIVGSSSERSLAEWLVEISHRESTGPTFENSVILVNASREKRDVSDAIEFLERVFDKGDLVIFCPDASRTEGLTEAAIRLQERGAMTFALGEADVALPLELHTCKSIPVGRSRLTTVQKEARLFLLFSLIGSLLEEKLSVAPEARPKGFFQARGSSFRVEN